jgi:hypothetical protein
VAGADETGPFGLPEIVIEGAREVAARDEAPPAADGTYPAGLTDEGRAAFKRLSREKTRDYQNRLGHELARAWLELGVSGPAEYTGDRVLAADAMLRADERRKITDEVDAKIRAELAGELQRAADPRQGKAKRATVHWRPGAALVAGATAANAAMLVPGGNAVLKLALVAATIAGTLISRPRGQ